MPNSSVQPLIDAYVSMVKERIAWGWSPTLLTFVFKPLGGSDAYAAAVMANEVERVYATMLTRTSISRRPRTRPAHEHSFWIVCPDYPIFKHERGQLADISLNGGRHMHGPTLTPPATRLKESLTEHVERNQHLYAGGKHPLARLHAIPMTSRPGFVVDYAMKGLKSSRVNLDDILIFPRTTSELPSHR